MWKPVSLNDLNFSGCRGRYNNEILSMTGMLGYEAAMSVGWMYKLINHVECMRGVRIVPYKITYDVKAYREEEDAEAVGEMFDGK